MQKRNKETFAFASESHNCVRCPWQSFYHPGAPGIISFTPIVIPLLGGNVIV
jgi:hypothetical protein